MMLATMLIATLAMAKPQAAPSLPKLVVRGENMVNPQGQKVVLRGADVGNWLILEGWMFGMGEQIQDQYDFEALLARRFGAETKDRLMNAYRANFMQPRDWDHLKSFRMNLVRLPINYRLLEDDAHPKQLRKDAFKWLDIAVKDAESHGMYVILDMHGIQGGQSVYDHTGQRDQNRIWTDELDQERAAWLWGQIAARYRDRNAVVAYDLFNEPYGGTKPQQVALFQRIYDAVRKVDREKLIFAHGHFDGFSHYGDPRTHGWHNVGFQMHYYPGLFGNGSPSPENQARHFRSMEAVERAQNALNVPFIVGEFNVVFDRAGGAAMMRRHFDTYANYGWMATMWSYKVLSQEGGTGPDKWGLVTNSKPMFVTDFRTAPLADVEKWVDQFRTMELTPYPDLLKWLAPETVELPPLPEMPKPITSAPQQTLPEWLQSDIGAKLGGGLARTDSGFDLYGAGADIWNESDEFRFLYQRVEGDFTLSVQIDGLLDTGSYAKAGLMARQTLTPESAHLALTMFPSGEFQIAQRAFARSETKGTEAGDSTGKGVILTMVRRGNQVEMFTQASADKPRVSVGSRDIAAGPVFVGVVASSHETGQLTRVQYRDLSLTRP